MKTCISTHTRKNGKASIHAQKYIYLYVHVCVYMCVYLYAHIQARKTEVNRTHISTCIYAYIHIHVTGHEHVYMYIHIHIHAYEYGLYPLRTFATHQTNLALLFQYLLRLRWLWSLAAFLLLNGYPELPKALHEGIVLKSYGAPYYGLKYIPCN